MANHTILAFLLGIAYAIIALIAGVIFLTLPGCRLFTGEAIALNTLPTEEKAEAIITITEMKAKLKAAHYTDRLMFLFLLGSATGIYAIIRGRPGEGWAVLGAGVGGVFLTMYVQRAYEIPLVWLFGGLVVIVGMVVFLHRDRIGKGAFKRLAKELPRANLTKAENKLVEKARKK